MMNTNNKVSRFVQFSLFSALFALVAGTLYAWSAPPAGAPPSCPSGSPGCDAPLNVSNTLQSKDGNLMVNAAGSFAIGFSVPFGMVAIGTTSPMAGGYKLVVDGDARFMNSTFANQYYYNSDRSLKMNVQTVPNALERVLQLHGVSFNWKKDGTPSVGVVAQEVEHVFPELVSTDAAGLKSVQYGNLVGPLIEAVKEQERKIDAQAKQIEELQKEIAALQARS